MSWKSHLPKTISSLYEIYEYKHAAVILKYDYPAEYKEIMSVLEKFRFTEDDVKISGGNESHIPKIFSEMLRPLNWEEKKLKAEVTVDKKPVSVDTHKVDYIKGRVAFDLEWNSKDQTFDRDLYAFRTFFDYDKISVGILVTRGFSLTPWFKSLGSYTDKYGNKRTYLSKYGASTTHMGKLLPRLGAGRNGGCPVLVFGITPSLLVKKEEEKK